MKIDKNSINENNDNPAWGVGDLIYGADTGLYLVARVTGLGGSLFYTLINLEGGYSSNSYESIAELQHHTDDPGDRILTGIFKYEADK